MTSLPQQIAARMFAVAGTDPELRPAGKPQFGHFQCNVAMKLGKQQGRPPREVAQELVDNAHLDDLCAKLEVAGPGFINIWCRPEAIAASVTALLADDRLGVPEASQPDVIALDYSAPNVAKQMHVGHLRSTVIGDCFHRVFRALGHRVIPRNHLGDWGTQFGMLVEQILFEDIDADALTLPEAEALYKRAQEHFASDEAFATASRARVVQLQGGDAETRRLWTALVTVSMQGFDSTYARMNVLLTDDDYVGESFYNDMLPEVVADLVDKGIAVEDGGALCVFVDGFEHPMIVRKSDGGYGYDATDMAAIRHRTQTLRATRLVYCTDVRQAPHFAQVFGAARRAGYVTDEVSTEHVGFGMVLGPNGKPYKTREGTAVHLVDLLDEAEKLTAPEIALAAIKYADLSNSLIKDYVFDLERMSAATGNTGPYLQYAHARTCAIFRKPEAEGLDDSTVTVVADPHEEALALLLGQFGEVVADVGHQLAPHKLCTYLYDVATAYSSFYEHCPVLASEGEVRTSRLALVHATQKVLARGLDLLGIAAPEVM